MKGTLTLSTLRGGPDGEVITIRIEDVTSGAVLLDLAMTHEALGKALVGHGNQPCLVTLHGLVTPTLILNPQEG